MINVLSCGLEVGCPIAFFPVLVIKKTVLRIRIRMFLGLLDPDPLVRGSDPVPDPSVIKQNQYENRFVNSLWPSLKNVVNVSSKSTGSLQKKLKKKYFLLPSWRSMTKIAGSGSRSGSISQRHGSVGIRNTAKNKSESGTIKYLQNWQTKLEVEWLVSCLTQKKEWSCDNFL